MDHINRIDREYLLPFLPRFDSHRQLVATETGMVQPSNCAWKLGDIHHLGLTVQDIERSIVFYRDVLGMTLCRRRPHVDQDYVAQQTGYPEVVLNVASFKVFPDSAQSLEIVQYMNHSGPPADTATNRPATSHLCLTVSDLRACYVDLKAEGVCFKSDPVAITAGPNMGGLVVYFYDPDGYVLELFQPPVSHPVAP